MKIVNTESVGRLEILVLKDGLIINALDLPGYKKDPVQMGIKEGYSPQEVADTIDWDEWARDWFMDDDDDDDA